jgi:hypothetical protein
MFTTSYGTVERALWVAYSVPETARASFRARLGHAQKAGIFGPEKQPGPARRFYTIRTWFTGCSFTAKWPNSA